MTHDHEEAMRLPPAQPKASTTVSVRAQRGLERRKRLRKGEHGGTARFDRLEVSGELGGGDGGARRRLRCHEVILKHYEAGRQRRRAFLPPERAASKKRKASEQGPAQPTARPISRPTTKGWAHHGNHSRL